MISRERERKRRISRLCILAKIDLQEHFLTCIFVLGLLSLETHIASSKVIIFLERFI